LRRLLRAPVGAGQESRHDATSVYTGEKSACSLRIAATKLGQYALGISLGFALGLAVSQNPQMHERHLALRSCERSSIRNQRRTAAAVSIISYFNAYLF
jgi:hypothetical protein